MSENSDSPGVIAPALHPETAFTQRLTEILRLDATDTLFGSTGAIVTE